MSLSSFRLGRCPGMVLIGLLAAALSNQAHAQGTAAAAKRPDPLDAQARVPVVIHSSALSSYRRLGDDRRIEWKEANETVNRIGGWRAYAREAQPGSAGSTPAGGATPAPASGPAPAHGGHKKP